MRFPFRVLFLIFPLSLCAFDSQAAADADQWKKISALDESTGNSLANLQIGNYDYKIPKNYFMGGADDPSCNHEAVGFIAMLPDFVGKTKDNIAILFKTTGPDNPTVNILFSARRDRKEDTSKALWANLEAIKNVYGPNTEMDSTYIGLHVLKPNTPKHSSRDILYSEKNGKLESVIDCTPLGTVVNPGCEHSFVVNDAVVKLTYRIRFLPDWKKIEDTARAFFTQATVGHATALKLYCKEY